MRVGEAVFAKTTNREIDRMKCMAYIIIDILSFPVEAADAKHAKSVSALFFQDV